MNERELVEAWEQRAYHLQRKGYDVDLEAAQVYRTCARELAALASAPAAPQGEAVGEVYTMEALVPGGGVKHHVTLHKPLPAGTKLYAAPDAALWFAYAEGRKDEAAEAVCQRCNGSGEQQHLTSHLGPDDYEVTGPCGLCRGTGSPHPTAQAVEQAGGDAVHQWPAEPAALLAMLEEMTDIAARVDGWASVPSEPLERAQALLAAQGGSNAG